jgi:hypothetical protein
MRFAILAAALAVCACQQATAPPPAPPPAPAAKLSPLPAPPDVAGCAMRAQAPWTRAGDGWRVVGDAKGADCPNAEVTIYLVDPAGGVARTDTFKAADLRAVFGDAAEKPAMDRASMSAALSAWIAPNDDQLFKHTGDLPPWATARSEPAGAGGEFPFRPEEGTSRAAYEKQRAANLPMFCYVQGAESMRCVVVEKGVLRSIGLQSFPG